MRTVKEKSLERILLRTKPVRMLVGLLHDKKSAKYISVIAKEVDCTYSHTVKTLQKLMEAGLVEFKKQGRLKLVKLTKDGKELAEYLRKALSIIRKK